MSLVEPFRSPGNPDIVLIYTDCVRQLATTNELCGWVGVV